MQLSLLPDIAPYFELPKRSMVIMEKKEYIESNGMAMSSDPKIKLLGKRKIICIEE